MTEQQQSPGTEFADKVALISGSSSGIGRIIAKMFAEQGGKVAIVASRDIDKACRVRDEINDAGGTAEAFKANIADISEVEELVGAVIDRFSTIDILINSAGVHYATFVGDTTEEEFDRLSDVNFKGAYFLMNSVAPIMKKQGSGKIVNITAQMADFPMAGLALYCATKAALASLTAAMAWELGPYGINCNAVAPGNTITPEHGDFMENEQFADVIQWFKDMTPSPRKVSTAADIANLVLFLASDKASSVYGTTIVADEGMTRAWNGYLPNGIAIFPDAAGNRRKIGD